MVEEASLHQSVDPLQRIIGRRSHRGVDDHEQLGRNDIEHPVDQGVFRREPVQDGLLPNADFASNLIQRDGIDPASTEQIDGRLDDPIPSGRDGAHCARLTAL